MSAPPDATFKRSLKYSTLLLVLAGGVATALVLTGESITAPWSVVALALAGVIAERNGVWITRTAESSVHLLPTVLAGVLFGPLAAAFVNAASMLGDAELLSRPNVARAPQLRWLTYTSTRFMGGAAAGYAAWFTHDLLGNGLGVLVVATLAGAITAEILDVVSAALTARVRGRSMAAVIRAHGSLVATSVLSYSPVVALLAYAYTEISAWTVTMFFLPALAAQRLFSLYQDKAHLLEEQLGLAASLRDANETLRTANASFAEALVQTLEESDQYTAGHSKAVAIYTRDIAAELGLSHDDRERAFLAGMVHDIGKIGLPSAVLNKQGRLTDEERSQMEKHSEIGERILSKVDAYADIAHIVRHHHERMDGHGYPDGLDGHSIPHTARMIAVADAYNAMTSDRPYRQAMPPETAIDRLLEGAGTQFDRSVVLAFISVLRRAGEEYRRARGAEFGRLDYWTDLSAMLRGSLVGSARDAA